ncbi:Ig-like domain-containing protein [Desulfoplanes sp.]
MGPEEGETGGDGQEPPDSPGGPPPAGMPSDPPPFSPKESPEDTPPTTQFTPQIAELDLANSIQPVTFSLITSEAGFEITPVLNKADPRIETDDGDINVPDTQDPDPPEPVDPGPGPVDPEDPEPEDPEDPEPEEPVDPEDPEPEEPVDPGPGPVDPDDPDPEPEDPEDPEPEAPEDPEPEEPEDPEPEPVDPPIAVEDSNTTSENAPLSIDDAHGVLINDTDPDDGDTHTVSAVNGLVQNVGEIVTGSNGGTFDIASDGAYTFDPGTAFDDLAEGEQRSTSVEYTNADNDGATDTATLSITVTGVNDAPEAPDQTVSMWENTHHTGFLTATDVDNSILNFSQTAQPANGYLSLSTTGAFEYTPYTDFTGTDTFSFLVTDPGGLSDTGTMTVTVNPNSAPTVPQLTFSTDENTPLTGVLVSDEDTGDTLSFTDITGPAHGTLSTTDQGMFTYTPETDFEGQDQFTFTVTDGKSVPQTETIEINVLPDNHPPTILQTTFSTDEDMVLSATLASDADEDSLSFTDISGPSHGDVTFFPGGTFTYTPDADYFGTDQFTGKVSDGTAASQSFTVNLTINPINDPPDAPDHQSITFSEDTSLSGTLVTDADGDALIFSDTQQPAHGTLQLYSDGSFSYTPDADYFGTDQFTTTVTDEIADPETLTVNLTIEPVNDAPVAQTSSVTTEENTPYVFSRDDFGFQDIDTDHLYYIKITGLESNGSLQFDETDVVLGQDICGLDINNGQLTFTPTPDAYGSPYDSFTFEVKDQSLYSANSATMTIEVIEETASSANQTFVTAPNLNIYGRLTPGGEVSENSSAVFYDLINPDDHSAVNLAQDGTFWYNSSDSGDSFDYIATDYTTDATYQGTVAIEFVNITDTGTDDADIIAGGDESDTLYGMAGNDIFIAGPGGDTIYGGDGIDTVDYTNASSGISNEYMSAGTTSILAVFGETEYQDDFQGIENIIGSDNGADNISGDENVNLFAGNGGGDYLYGEGGADILFGGEGDDFLYGGAGNDFLEGNAGNDELTGGAGIDHLTGGAGSDRFAYIYAEDFGDIIHDFNHDDDTLQFYGSTCFPSSGASAIDGTPDIDYFHEITDPDAARTYIANGTHVYTPDTGESRENDYFVYLLDPDSGTNKLYFDDNGTSGTNTPILIAEFDQATVLDNTDITISGY